MTQQQPNRGAFGKRRKVYTVTLTFSGGETSITQPAGAPAVAGFSSDDRNVAWIAKTRGGGTAGTATDRNIFGLQVNVQADGSLWLSGGLAAAANAGTVLVDLIQL